MLVVLVEVRVKARVRLRVKVKVRLDVKVRVRARILVIGLDLDGFFFVSDDFWCHQWLWVVGVSLSLSLSLFCSKYPILLLLFYSKYHHTPFFFSFSLPSACLHSRLARGLSSIVVTQVAFTSGAGGLRQGHLDVLLDSHCF